MPSNTARQLFAPAALRGLPDRLGLLVSSACILHCLSAPLLLLLLPPVGLSLLEYESTLHWSLFSLAFLVSLAAFVWHSPGNTRDVWVLAAAFVGLTSLYLGAARIFGALPEVPLTVFGAGLLAFAHLRNWRRRVSPHPGNFTAPHGSFAGERPAKGSTADEP